MFNNTNDRTIHFAGGNVANVKLTNSEIKIHQDFDLSKDTKFSMRTLLLLCVFCIGVFGFGLNPLFFGYNLSTNYRCFVVFCLLVLLGQAFIAWFQYSLNKEKLKRYLWLQKQEIERLRTANNHTKTNLDNFYKNKLEILKHPFPQNILNQEVTTEAQLDEVLKPILNEHKKQYDYSMGELKEAKTIYRNSNMVYKWINGYIAAALTIVAIILGVFSFVYNDSIADKFFKSTNEIQYLSINIENINPICLIKN